MKKRSASPPAVTPAPSDADLPEGWMLVPIKDIADVNPRHPKGLDDSMPVSFAPMSALSEAGPAFASLEERPYGEVRKGFTHFGEGDVLFAKITPCMENGKGAIATGLRNGIGCGTTELHVLRPLGKIDALYLYRFLSQHSVRRDAKETFTSSAGQARVPTRFIEELDIPLPPLPEQKRIVAKVEELLVRVNAARERLGKIPALLKRFRQSVLAAACSGRLTEEWRATHPASEISNPPTSSPPEQSDLPEIPGTWRWVCFRQLLTDFRNGISTKPNIDPPGQAILRISAVRSMSVNLDDHRYLASDETKTEMYRLVDGDLLFTRYNGSLDLLGVCGLVCGLDDRLLLYPDKLMRARVQRKFVLPEYCQMFFSENSARLRMVGESKSSAGQQGISGTDVKNQPLALPPLPEQHEIVRQVKRLFALADSIEKQVAAGTARTEKLTQAILAKAFRGELAGPPSCPP